MLGYIITGIACLIVGIAIGIFIVTALIISADDTEEHELQPLQEHEKPTPEDARKAGRVIKEFCNNRNYNPETDCTECPIKDICLNEPYLWEV